VESRLATNPVITCGKTVAIRIEQDAFGAAFARLSSNVNTLRSAQQAAG
jgi:hypothetical protein